MLELQNNLIPFDDTFVLYNPDDIVSFVSVYFSLLPIFILIFYFSWFLTSRELEAIIIAAGHVGNDIVNNILKNYLKQPRPYEFTASFQKDTIRSGYGMPSAHSQFMGFLAMYVTLRIWLYWTDLTKLRKVVSTAALFVSAALVAGSRVYLGYHSLWQVTVGVSLGVAVGGCYFFAVSIARSLGIIDFVLSLGIVKMFWIKDSCYTAPLTLKDEYSLWKARAAKKTK